MINIKYMLNKFLHYVYPSTPVPLEINRSEELFRTLLMAVAAFNGLGHAAFLVMLYFCEIYSLALFNIASVICYVICFRLARLRMVKASWLLLAAEVTIHGVAATLIIGWDASFHLYILLLLPVFMISGVENRVLRYSLTASITGIYIWMDIFLKSAQPSGMMNPLTIAFLDKFNLMTYIVIAIVMTSLYYRLVVKTEHYLREMAATDPLTGLRNRRSMHESAIMGAAGQRRYGRPVSFVMCDIDFFKNINDTYGHESGDEVLKSIAQIIKNEVREIDHAARWGGEEFLLLLPETPLQGGLLTAERLRKTIELQKVQVKNATISLTMTFGVSTLELDGSVLNAIDRADMALLEGKRTGRNRVVAAMVEDIPASQGAWSNY